MKCLCEKINCLHLFRKEEEQYYLRCNKFQNIRNTQYIVRDVEEDIIKRMLDRPYIYNPENVKRFFLHCPNVEKFKIIMELENL